MNAQQFISKKISYYPINFSADNINIAREFILNKWIERHQERYGLGGEIPTNLSHSCKFSSLFCSYVFGSLMQGNIHHQYSVLNGIILDFNFDAKDVKNMKNPYEHDAVFWGNPLHKKSLKSCSARVTQWLEEFPLFLEQKKSINMKKVCHDI